MRHRNQPLPDPTQRSRQMDELLAEIRTCQTCSQQTPPGRRPVLQASAASRLLIVSQAPGRKVEETGIPFNDVSGDRLREWLQIDRDVFHDAERVAIVPMDFCFPGKGKSGDLASTTVPVDDQCATDPGHWPVRTDGFAGRRACRHAHRHRTRLAHPPGPWRAAVATSEPTQPTVGDAQPVVRSGVAAGAARTRCGGAARRRLNFAAACLAGRPRIHLTCPGWWSRGNPLAASGENMPDIRP
jgi:hypothetical protein